VEYDTGAFPWQWSPILEHEFHGEVSRPRYEHQRHERAQIVNAVAHGEQDDDGDIERVKIVLIR
jgi:hypothetical protein